MTFITGIVVHACRYCCEQCEQHKGTTNRRGLRLLKKQTKSKSHLPSTTARETFLHLDDNKCAIWHVDSKLQYCHLWNANRGAPRSWKGHHTGIPEGQCPTQLSNTAVTPHQVRFVGRRFMLPPGVYFLPASYASPRHATTDFLLKPRSASRTLFHPMSKLVQQTRCKRLTWELDQLYRRSSSRKRCFCHRSGDNSKPITKSEQNWS